MRQPTQAQRDMAEWLRVSQGRDGAGFGRCYVILRGHRLRTLRGMLRARMIVAIETPVAGQRDLALVTLSGGSA